MAVQAGALLINRRRVNLPQGVITTVDTGLRQVNQNFAPDPGLDGASGSVPSRVMVVPMAPLSEWDGVNHGEPYLGSGGTVQVDFESSAAERDINVMFWDPHTWVGPVSADTYGVGPLCLTCEFVGQSQSFSAQT